jgi:hypothetical protein
MEKVYSYCRDLEKDETMWELEVKGMQCLNTRHSFVGL